MKITLTPVIAAAILGFTSTTIAAPIAAPIAEPEPRVPNFVAADAKGMEFKKHMPQNKTSPLQLPEGPIPVRVSPAGLIIPSITFPTTHPTPTSQHTEGNSEYPLAVPRLSSHPHRRPTLPKSKGHNNSEVVRISAGSPLSMAVVPMLEAVVATDKHSKAEANKNIEHGLMEKKIMAAKLSADSCRNVNVTAPHRHGNSAFRVCEPTQKGKNFTATHDSVRKIMMKKKIMVDKKNGHAILP